MSRSKVLLIKLGSLGDIIQATPMIDALHANHAEVFVLTFSKHVDLVLYHPNVAGVLAIPSSFLGKIKVLIKVYLLRFDVVINAHRSVILDFLCWLFWIPIRIGFASPEKSTRFLTQSQPFDLNQTRQVRYLSLIEQWTNTCIDHQQFQPAFFPNPSVTVDLIQGPYVVVAPFGGHNDESQMPTRVWPKYPQLIGGLLNNNPNIQVVLVGGAKDQAGLKKIQQSFHSRVHIGGGSIHELALVLQSAAVFIGNDSFPLAMAISQQCDAIGIFGPTSARIIVADYLFVVGIQSTVCCSPCYNPLDGVGGVAYHCPYATKCMKHIQVIDVLKLVQMKLDKKIKKKTSKRFDKR